VELPRELVGFPVPVPERRFDPLSPRQPAALDREAELDLEVESPGRLRT
jgi:hypothetical protein